MSIKRKRTPSKYIGYGLYLYFLGLSYRNTSKALAQFVKIVMLQSGKGFKNINPRKLLEIGKEYLGL
ncbi:hypothetical protein [Candidatus Nitrosocosmicus sp. R]